MGAPADKTSGIGSPHSEGQSLFKDNLALTLDESVPPLGSS